MYHKKHWLDENGDSIPSFCLVSRVKFNRDKNGTVENLYRNRLDLKKTPEDGSDITEQDILNLPEMHPPDEMPNGNVGTPTMHFLKLIQQCRLAPVIIKKLGLVFPKTRSSKVYGNVEFDYGTRFTPDDIDYGTRFTCDDKGADNSDDLCVKSAKGHIIEALNEEDSQGSGETGVKGLDINNTECHKFKKKKKPDKTTKELMDEMIEEKMIEQERDLDSEDDNDTCQEYERHEALYDDPTNQERNNERLFEEEVEVTWDKGSSGLVFYTDAQYWKQQEGDFDEQTADDWDVDMSAYYEKSAGDMDIKDFIQMRQDERRRNGIENTDRYTVGITKQQVTSEEISPHLIGQFENHSKGVARKIMHKQGWKDGDSLGTTVKGIPDALENEGQHPRDKSGFGFRDGGKYQVKSKPKRAEREVIISTIYDRPADNDPAEPLLRRNTPYHLSYRDEVTFKKSNEILKPKG